MLGRTKLRSSPSCKFVILVYVVEIRDVLFLASTTGFVQAIVLFLKSQEHARGLAHSMMYLRDSGILRLQ